MKRIFRKRGMAAFIAMLSLVSVFSLLFAGCPKDIDDPEPDRAALSKALADAESAKQGVEISTDAIYVLMGTQWVLLGEFDAHETAIEAAKNVNNKNASQGDVDSATAALVGATAAFIAAKKDGAKIEAGPGAANKVDLANTISLAIDRKGTTISATNAADILWKHFWASPALLSAFETQINNAATVNADENATQSAVDAAKSTLDAAISTFVAARARGTKLELPAYTMIPVTGAIVATTISYRPLSNVNHGAFADASNNPVTVGNYKIGETEVTYELWYEVRSWAETVKGYTFNRKGREGHNGEAGVEPTSRKFEPVTYISHREMVVWCNAYSEALGKTPVYYEDSAFQVLLKVAESGNDAYKKADKSTIKTDADGFRLPTLEEWEFAARGGSPGNATNWTYHFAGAAQADYDQVVWLQANSGLVTHPVKQKAPNLLGLYDMSGNVSERCQGTWKNSTITESTRDWPHIGGHWNEGSTARDVSFTYTSVADSGNDTTGFRLVAK